MAKHVQNWFGQCKKNEKVFNIYFNKIGKQYVVATIPAEGTKLIDEANDCATDWEINRDVTMLDFKEKALPWLKRQVGFEKTLDDVDIGVEISVENPKMITLCNEDKDEHFNVRNYNYALTIELNIEKEKQPLQKYVKLAHYNIFACLNDTQLRTLNLENVRELKLQNSEYIMISYDANGLSKCAFGHTQNNASYTFFVPRMSPWKWLGMDLKEDDRKAIDTAYNDKENSNKGLPFHAEDNTLMSKREAEDHLKTLKNAVEAPESEDTEQRLKAAIKLLKANGGNKEKRKKAATLILEKCGDNLLISDYYTEDDITKKVLERMAKALDFSIDKNKKKDIVAQNIVDQFKTRSTEDLSGSSATATPDASFQEQVQQAHEIITGITKAKEALNQGRNEEAAKWFLSKKASQRNVKSLTLDQMAKLAAVLNIEVPQNVTGKKEKADIIWEAIGKARKKDASKFVSLRLSRAPLSLRLSRKRVPNKF